MAYEYTIGEAAKFLGISRDALRFYERKNLVAPEKKENGYRFYSKNQISVLTDIIFLRKLQCSLQDIQAMYEDGTPEYWVKFLELRIKEEQEQIKMHQQLLRQLKVSRENGKKMAQLNQFSLQSSPKSYIFSEIMEDFDQAQNEWLRGSREKQGLEHCYIHEQQMPGAEGGRYQSYLLLEEFAVKTLGLEEQAKSLPSFRLEQCVYTVAKSKSMSPEPETISQMYCWAKSQGLTLTGEIHSHYLWSYQESGKWKESYVEIYMPVAK